MAVHVTLVDAGGNVIGPDNPLNANAAAAEGLAYTTAVYTFALATDNTLLTFVTDVLLDLVFIQNESATETAAIVKLDNASIGRAVLEAKRGVSIVPPHGPMRVAAGVALKVNLSGANAHSATVYYRAA